MIRPFHIYSSKASIIYDSPGFRGFEIEPARTYFIKRIKRKFRSDIVRPFNLAILLLSYYYSDGIFFGLDMI